MPACRQEEGQGGDRAEISDGDAEHQPDALPTAGDERHDQAEEADQQEGKRAAAQTVTIWGAL